MAGLIKENFKDEILTELSWIKNAINDISDRLKIETYEIALIKYCVQPEEEKAIDKFFVFNFKVLKKMKSYEKQELVSKYFFEMTNRKWTLDNDILDELIKLKLEKLEISD